MPAYERNMRQVLFALGFAAVGAVATTLVVGEWSWWVPAIALALGTFAYYVALGMQRQTERRQRVIAGASMIAAAAFQVLLPEYRWWVVAIAVALAVLGAVELVRAYRMPNPTPRAPA